MEMQSSCPECKMAIVPQYYFCPNCGKKLIEKPPSTSVSQQIGVYLISLLLPPFGIAPAMRYLRQSDDKSKIVGIICILITVLSVVVSIYIAIDFYNQMSQAINSQMGIPGLYGY